LKTFNFYINRWESGEEWWRSTSWQTRNDHMASSQRERYFRSCFILSNPWWPFKEHIDLSSILQLNWIMPSSRPLTKSSQRISNLSLRGSHSYSAQTGKTRVSTIRRGPHICYWANITWWPQHWISCRPNIPGGQHVWEVLSFQWCLNRSPITPLDLIRSLITIGRFTRNRENKGLVRWYASHGCQQRHQIRFPDSSKHSIYTINSVIKPSASLRYGLIDFLSPLL